MIELIVAYFIGLFCTSSLLLLQFYSPLKVTLGKLLFNEDFVVDEEFDDRIFIINKNLGTLVACWTCSSFWLSLLVGTIFLFLFSLKWWYPILTFFSYPTLLWAIKVYILNKKRDV